MPRVGVNLTWLVPGVVGGSEEATVRALAAVADAASSSADVVLLGTAPLFAAHPGLAERFEHRTLGAGAGRVRRVLIESTELHRVATTAHLDVLHHAGGVLPLRSIRPAVVAVHDIQPIDLPDNFGVVKRRYLGAMLPRSVRHADALTAPSEYVRGRLVDRLGADPSRVSVVPWSVRPFVEPAPEARRSVRDRYGLHRPFVLYPAIPYVHKNHSVLLDAVARLGGDGPDLVLTGAPGPLDARIGERADAPDLAGRVHRLGRVGAADLAALLAESAVVAVPSRYEGFGLPALEALSAGRPCVVSSAGSLPEVVGDGALVVDPDDVDAWADALAAVLSDDVTRRRLESAGPIVAASWSPQRTATALLDVWQRCLDASSSTPRNPA